MIHHTVELSKSPGIMCVQDIGGYSLLRRDYLEYIGGCSVHRRDTMIHVGDIMSTSGGGGGVFSTSEGYHEYIGGTIHVGEQIDKSL